MNDVKSLMTIYVDQANRSKKKNSSTRKNMYL